MFLQLKDRENKMAELTKIYRGMQNGAETIDENLTKINTELEAVTVGAVRNSGDETIAGKKTFTDNTSVNNLNVTGTFTSTGDVPKTEIKSFWTNFKEYTSGVYPTYSVKNGRVVLQGVVSPKTDQAGGPTTNYGVFYLPAEIVPHQDIVILSQGSGYNKFCAIVGTDGTFRVGRYNRDGNDLVMSTGAWLPFSFTYDL